MNRHPRLVAATFSIITLQAIPFSIQMVAGDEAIARPIRVVNRRLLASDDIPTLRVPLGIDDDYKPFVARLKSGQLLAVAFCFGPIERGQRLRRTGRVLAVRRRRPDMGSS